MNRSRQVVAAAAALTVLAEAVGLGGMHWVLGLAVRAQEMSLAGLSTSTMSASVWVGGALLAVFLLACAGALALVALRDRLGGRWSRALIVGALVTQAVLAVIAVGMVGWWAFAALMALFGLLLLTLCFSYPSPAGAPGPVAA
ncbi:hypothetical protein [Streptomyces otsuchiensis]|uniref:hypothetical protein n=1 Tax=Streptomyces otsuchiensis TaxID=2681388 RepID=UPI0010325147|nr:hypothetical protein [Streptomyces otsuchiensis]